LEELKNAYAPFDPDAATKVIKPLTDEDRQQKLEQLLSKFESLMERANFKKLDQSVLTDANRQASAFGLKTHVDLRIFEKIAAFARGEGHCTRFRRHWLFFWRKQAIELHLFKRLAVIAKLRPSRRLGPAVDTNAVYLKIFKDVPRMDLEMLLPGARLRMPGFQRLKMGGSWIGGLAYLLYSIGTQAFEALTRGMWFILYGPLIALLGYGYKQWYGYQSTKTAYGLRLSQSLYFQTLDCNAGVLFHLLDEAEEQECREAILAYFCLLKAGDAGWPSDVLDNHVESDLQRLTGVTVDFEIIDALAKLERHKLIERQGDRFRALPLEKALQNLDHAWDNYFKHDGTAKTHGAPTS
jgi:hypothetical protein